MEKRYQIFVSSTYADLQEERRNVMQTLMEMDCIPAGMEIFPAMDEEQWEFIKRIITDCDYYILIIGGRYGSLTSEGISYTEKEYNFAISLGLKVIAFLHKNPEEIPAKNSEFNPELRVKLDEFRNRVSQGRLIKFWSTADELPGLVSTSLSKTIKTYPATGWVRANKVANLEVLSDINDLRKERKGLEDQITEKERTIKEFQLLAEKQWSLQHNLINIFLNHYFWDIRNKLPAISATDLTQLDSIKRDYLANTCRTILNEIRNSFLEHYHSKGFQIEDDLTITIKLVSSIDNANKVLNLIKGDKSDVFTNKAENYVMNGYWDSHTWKNKPERTEIIRIVYQINEQNTVFNEIVNKGKDFYLSNNLHKDYENGQYHDQNERWENQYNAILAVPIRYQRQGYPRATLIYGVISIDSLNHEKHELFEENYTYYLLATSSDLLALIFEQFDLISILEEKIFFTRK